MVSIVVNCVIAATCALIFLGESATPFERVATYALFLCAFTLQDVVRELRKKQ